jgi:predicted RNA binding protein YcfA (HicA-like mRNA interferase family)
MHRLLSSKEIISILKQNGFIFVSQKGSHKKFKKAGKIVIVPDHKKEIPRGTFSSILRQSGLDKQAFKLID